MPRKARVLVADDDPEMLDTVATVVNRLGHHVVRVASGAELIQRVAEEGPFDLIVTDVAMPWMSGLQVAHAVRSAGLDTPLLVITALRDERFEKQLAALGQRATLLRKPFELEALQAAVRALLPQEPDDRGAHA